MVIIYKSSSPWKKLSTAISADPRKLQLIVPAKQWGSWDEMLSLQQATRECFMSGNIQLMPEQNLSLLSHQLKRQREIRESEGSTSGIFD